MESSIRMIFFAGDKLHDLIQIEISLSLWQSMGNPPAVYYGGGTKNEPQF